METITYTTEVPEDFEFHSIQSIWQFGACDIISSDERGKSLIMNITSRQYPKIRQKLDNSIVLKEVDRSTFELLVLEL